jgi:hypothetical protein
MIYNKKMKIADIITYRNEDKTVNVPNRSVDQYLTNLFSIKEKNL